jgi:hypothetical protein
MRILVLALVLLAAVAAGAARADSWSSLHRALVLKPLAAGARCPVTPSRKLDRGRVPNGVGAGPAYPMPARFGPDGRHPGWIASKTLWGWPPELSSKGVHVLVRGRRLDAPGEVRFQLGPDWDTTPLRGELHVDTTSPVGDFGSSRWGATVTLLFVRQPGCYGLQLDSERATSTIVIRAR